MKELFKEYKSYIFLIIFLIIFIITILISNLYYLIPITEILRYTESLSLIFLLVALPFLMLEKRATIKLNIFALVSFLILLLFLGIKVVWSNHCYVISWNI